MIESFQFPEDIYKFIANFLVYQNKENSLEDLYPYKLPAIKITDLSRRPQPAASSDLNLKIVILINNYSYKYRKCNRI